MLKKAFVFSRATKRTAAVGCLGFLSFRLIVQFVVSLFGQSATPSYGAIRAAHWFRFKKKSKSRTNKNEICYLCFVPFEEDRAMHILNQSVLQMRPSLGSKLNGPYRSKPQAFLKKSELLIKNRLLLTLFELTSWLSNKNLVCRSHTDQCDTDETKLSTHCQQSAISSGWCSPTNKTCVEIPVKQLSIICSACVQTPH